MPREVWKAEVKPMVENEHQSFLNRIALPDMHYTFDDAPIAYLSNSKNITKSTIDSAVRHKSPVVQISGVSHELSTPEHIDYVMQHGSSNVKKYAMLSNRVSKQHIDLAIQDSDPDVRSTALMSDIAGPEHVTVGLADSNPAVRLNAVRHPAITDEQLHHVLQHEKDDFIKQMAQITLKRRKAIKSFD